MHCSCAQCVLKSNLLCIICNLPICKICASSRPVTQVYKTSGDGGGSSECKCECTF